MFAKIAVLSGVVVLAAKHELPDGTSEDATAQTQSQSSGSSQYDPVAVWKPFQSYPAVVLDTFVDSYVEGTKAMADAHVQAAGKVAQATKQVAQANNDVFATANKYAGNAYEQTKQYADQTGEQTGQLVEELQKNTEAVMGETVQSVNEVTAESMLFQAKMALTGALTSLTMALTSMVTSIGTFLSASIAYISASIASLFTFGSWTQKSVEVNEAMNNQAMKNAPKQADTSIPQKAAEPETTLAKADPKTHLQLPGWEMSNPWGIAPMAAIPSSEGAPKSPSEDNEDEDAAGTDEEEDASTARFNKADLEEEPAAVTPEEPTPEGAVVLGAGRGFLQVRQSSDGVLKTIRRH